MFPEKLLLRATWGGRDDSPESHVEMVWDCMERLSGYGGFMGRLPWYVLFGKGGNFPAVTSRAELGREMARVYDSDAGPSYSFFQAPLCLSGEEPPHMHFRFSSQIHGGPRLAANTVVLQFEVGEERAVSDPLPVGWLLGLGPRLVRDFVEVWRPDAVSFDALPLLDLSPYRGSGFPKVGFQSWLSGSVVAPGLLPDVPVRESFRGGVFIGIDPESPDPVGEASVLAQQVYASRALRGIPFVQGEPLPDDA